MRDRIDAGFGDAASYETLARKVARVDGKLVNTIIKTYPQVSQFWTYDPKAFVQQPVFSRDFPPSKNLE